MISAIANQTSKVILRGGRNGHAANTAMRSISIGTDIADSDHSFQPARPWHMDDKSGSNLAADNALTLSNLFKGRTVALFGIPAPFTGICTTFHYPAYQRLQDDFKAKGVDEIVCYCCSDPCSMYHWGKALGNDFDKISFLVDDNGEFAKSHGLDQDYSAVSLGIRSERFSMIVKDGIVKSFNKVEDAGADAEILLEQV